MESLGWEDENWRLGSTTLRRVAGELEAENWQGGSTTVVHGGVAEEWEEENWRVGSTT